MTTLLQLLPDLGPNGAAKQVALLAPALARLGLDVQVAAVGAADLLAEPLSEAGIAVHFLGATSRYDVAPLLALRRLVNELRPDVVHAWRRPALRLAGALRLWQRFPLTAGDLLADNRVGTCVDRWLQRRCDYVVASSAAEVAALEHHGIASARIVEIPLAVGPVAPVPERASLCHELGIPEDARVIACAGALEYGKGFREAVWVFDVMRYVYPDMWLLLIGDGPARAEVEASAYRVGKADARICFAGSRDDVPQLLGLAELVWIAGRHGGRNVALEALSAGRPIVAFDRPELRCLVGDDAGLFAPAGDRHEFAKATRRLLDDSPLREKCGAAARRRAGMFQVETVQARWQELVRSAVTAGRSGL